MSEFTSVITMSETEACRAIAAAVAEGVRAEPQLAAGKVIDSLRAAFGPLVQKIVALIEAGANNLPAILAALIDRRRDAALVGRRRRQHPDRGDEAAVNRRVGQASDPRSGSRAPAHHNHSQKGEPALATRACPTLPPFPQTPPHHDYQTIRILHALPAGRGPGGRGDRPGIAARSPAFRRKGHRRLKPVLRAHCRPRPELRTADVAIAAQKARLALSDGRTATFAFNASAGTLTAHAADRPGPGVQLRALAADGSAAAHAVAYSLSRSRAAAQSAATASAGAATPSVEPPRAVHLRSGDAGRHAAAAAGDPRRAAIAGLPGKALPAGIQLRKRHVSAGAAHTASYRFLPATADVSALAGRVARHLQRRPIKPAPWLLVVNEAGQTVVDQTWPGSVEETLTLLEKFGGQ